MNTQNNFKGIFMLFTCALIWGTAFVAQSVGADYLGPFSFNGIRSFLGAVFLLPCIFFLDRLSGKQFSLWGTDDPKERKMLIKGGIICGTALVVASTLQQVGIHQTSVGKAGFITALYIIIVPIIGKLIGRAITFIQWICVLIAAAGMYFICINETFTLNIGDMIILLSAFCFAVHILVIEHYTKQVDGVRMSALQFFVCGLLSLPMILFGEKPTFADIGAAWMPICYAGIMSCGIAYTLQIVGQKYVHVVLASILLSLESVFSVLAGWALLGEILTVRELIGCALIFFAILLAQLPPSVFKKNK